MYLSTKFDLQNVSAFLPPHFDLQFWFLCLNPRFVSLKPFKLLNNWILTFSFISETWTYKVTAFTSQLVVLCCDGKLSSSSNPCSVFWTLLYLIKACSLLLQRVLCSLHLPVFHDTNTDFLISDFYFYLIVKICKNKFELLLESCG